MYQEEREREEVMPPKVAKKLIREPFVEVPEVFHRDLTPDRYRARLELYQRAYEVARQQAAERKKAFVPPFRFDEDYEGGGGI